MVEKKSSLFPPYKENNLPSEQVNKVYLFHPNCYLTKGVHD